MSGVDRVIRWSTALVVLGVAVVAAVVSYQHGYEVVRSHGETGSTARLVPLTVDGLIYASSMVLLHSARRDLPVPALARWLLGVGITATLFANIAHGWAHGPVGAAVAVWPAVALVGSYELLMWLVRTQATRPALEDAGPYVPVDEAPRPEPDHPEPCPDQAAAHAYRVSVSVGVPLSERKLATQFERSRRWARRIIATVRDETAPSDNAKRAELIAATEPAGAD